MNIEPVTSHYSVSDQISVADVQSLADQGVELLVCNRPDGEARDQTAFAEIEAAAHKAGMQSALIAITASKIGQGEMERFMQLVQSGKRIHAYCRTGSRSKRIWREAHALLGGEDEYKHQFGGSGAGTGKNRYQIVIIGAGSSGIATASSLLKRDSELEICLIDPAEDHYYQPGWTMVGGGVFDAETTHRKTLDLIPRGVHWIRDAVIDFMPDNNQVELSSGATIEYQQLVVAPGLKLDWAAVEGLQDTLGKNGVTSNYRFDLAPYTWQLVQNLKQGKALFTQPPMPIKCAGAPQKAMYLSASEWSRNGSLPDIEVDFYNAGAVLFGVDDYVPALMSYVQKYGSKLHFNHTLVKVDGATQTAWFKSVDEDGVEQLSETHFDLLHVCPPQCAPDFVRDSALADQAGWLDVDPGSLQHVRYDNIWGVGDVMNTTNAKTMAAARKQAPVVAQNICNVLQSKVDKVVYDGYGSCPLTVEHGKIVLAEFGYGGKLSPSFPNWLNDGTKPTWLGWFLKASVLPYLYWYGMLRGREWLAGPGN